MGTDDVIGSERARGRGPDPNKENADMAMGSKVWQQVVSYFKWFKCLLNVNVVS